MYITSMPHGLRLFELNISRGTHLHYNTLVRRPQQIKEIIKKPNNFTVKTLTVLYSKFK